MDRPRRSKRESALSPKSPSKQPTKKAASPEPERRSRGRPKKKEESKSRSVSRSRGRPRRKKEPSTSEESEDETLSGSRSRSVSVSERNNKKPTPNRANSHRKSEEQQSRLAGVKKLTIPLDASEAISKAIRRSLSREPAKTDGKMSKRITTKKLTTHSEYIEVSNTEIISVNKKVEFGGNLGSLLLAIVTAAIVFGLILGCTKEQCLLKAFHVPRNWRVYLNLQSLAALTLFILSQALLSVILPGRIVKSSATSAIYRANGFLALLLSIAAIAGLWYFGHPITRLYEWFVPLAVESYILAVLLAAFAYAKAGYGRLFDRNPYGSTGSVIHDFYVGREINTMIYNINLKIVLYRFSVIAAVLINALFTLKAFEVRKEVSHTLALLCGLNLIISLDELWFEELFALSFASESEGLGLMAIQQYLLGPFFKGVLVKFVLAYNINLPDYHLGIAAFLFFAGYYISRKSDLQKSVVRTRPNALEISNLKTIRTDSSKELVASGWWGVVKHPNYLGHIMMAWATASLVGFTHVLPYTVPLILTVFLVHRAVRDDRRCREKYHRAWREYSLQVPKLIIPGVF